MDDSLLTSKMTSAARDDLEEVYEYISHELYNVSAVEHLMDKMEIIFARLKGFPFSCNDRGSETLVMCIFYHIECFSI